MSEEFDFEQFEKELFDDLEKTAKINEQIQEERKKAKTTEELIEQAKTVNEWAKDLNVKTKIIVPKKNEDE